MYLDRLCQVAREHGCEASIVVPNEGPPVVEVVTTYKHATTGVVSFETELVSTIGQLRNVLGY